MKKTIETSFKRIETKYIVAKDDVKDSVSYTHLTLPTKA